MHVCFPFHHGTFTRRVFKYCYHNQSTEKAPASQFYSSQHLDNGREKTMSYVYTVSGINTVLSFLWLKIVHIVIFSALWNFLMVF